VRQRIAEFDYTKEVVDVFGAYCDVIAFAFLHYLAGDFAADVSDLRSRLRTPASRVYERIKDVIDIVRELHVLLGKPVAHLFLDQELLGNFDLSCSV